MQGLQVLNFAQGGLQSHTQTHHELIDAAFTLNDHLPSQYACTRLPAGTSRLKLNG
jgi:hypothetical protein